MKFFSKNSKFMFGLELSFMLMKPSQVFKAKLKFISSKSLKRPIKGFQDKTLFIRDVKHWMTEQGLKGVIKK